MPAAVCVACREVFFFVYRDNGHDAMPHHVVVCVLEVVLVVCVFLRNQLYLTHRAQSVL